MPPPTPWLNPPDIAGEYARGLQLGASIGEAQQRAQAEQQRTELEYAARMATQKREVTMQEQQLATQRAFHDQQNQLRQAALAQAAQVNAQKTQAAAAKFAQSQKFNALVKSGVDPMRAVYEAGLGTPQTATAQIGQQQAAQRFAETQKQHAETQRHNLETEAAAKTRINKPAKLPGLTELTDAQFALKDPEKKKQVQDLMSRRIDEMLSSAGTPKSASFAPAPPVKDRKAGETYLTPKGPHTWNGKGWQVYQTEANAQ